jgi:hypothetical protein
MRDQHPLDIKVLDTDTGEVAFSKGHHVLYDFRARVTAAMGEPRDTWTGPWHNYWRRMPGCSGHEGRFVDAGTGGPGAFPVTWMARESC